MERSYHRHLYPAIIIHRQSPVRVPKGVSTYEKGESFLVLGNLRLSKGILAHSQHALGSQKSVPLHNGIRGMVAAYHGEKIGKKRAVDCDIRKQ